MLNTNLRLIADLADGSTIVGSCIYIEMTVPKDSRFQVCTLSVLSDTLGSLDIDAKHIVRIGTDPSRLTETKTPEDVLSTLAEIYALTANAAIEDVNGLSGPDRLGVIKDDAQFACKEYEQPLKDLAIRLATKFATAKVEG